MVIPRLLAIHLWLYFTDRRILVAWCEKLSDYDYFKTNKIQLIEVLDRCYPHLQDIFFLTNRSNRHKMPSLCLRDLFEYYEKY
jgi:predicted DNA-binding transcriptional regulator YafY